VTGLLAIAVDPENLFSRQLTDLEKTQLPFVTMLAINQTAFETRQEWAQIMPKVFDRPTPLTQRAVLYRKATKDNLAADIFIRDEAFKGVSPAKYLEAQVMGGTRRRTGKERKLAAAGLLPAGHFAVPGLSAELDRYGNISLGQVNRILSQIGAQSDSTSNESDVSRARRQKREVRTTGRETQFFAVKKPRGRLAAGIYRRVKLGKLGTAVQSVLRFVRSVHYRPRYQIYNLAQRIFDSRFPANFDKAMATSLASAWSRAFKR
jgi:hypothetical protein